MIRKFCAMLFVRTYESACESKQMLMYSFIASSRLQTDMCIEMILSTYKHKPFLIGFITRVEIE